MDEKPSVHVIKITIPIKLPYIQEKTRKQWSR